MSTDLPPKSNRLQVTKYIDCQPHCLINAPDITAATRYFHLGFCPIYNSNICFIHSNFLNVILFIYISSSIVLLTRMPSFQPKLNTGHLVTPFKRNVCQLLQNICKSYTGSHLGFSTIKKSIIL